MGDINAAIDTGSYAGQQGSVYGMYGQLGGQIGGTIDGYFHGPVYKARMEKLHQLYDAPQLQQLQLGSPTTGLDSWLSQVPYSDRLNQVLGLLNSQGNAAYQKTLSSADANLIDNSKQFGANTAAELRGEIPKDVQDQIQRSTAYQSLAGGFAGSPMGTALTARDLGRTSLDLTNQGGKSLQEEMMIAHGLNPYSQTAQDLFTDPQALLQRQDRANVYNNTIQNEQVALNYASNLAINGGNTGALTSMLGGMYGGRGNFNQPAAAPSGGGGGGMNISSLMKLFGGGGGGGGGSNNAPYGADSAGVPYAGSVDGSVGGATAIGG